VRACSSGWFIGRFCDVDSVFAAFKPICGKFIKLETVSSDASEGVDRVDELSLYRYRITVRLAQQSLEEIGMRRTSSTFSGALARLATASR